MIYLLKITVGNSDEQIAELNIESGATIGDASDAVMSFPRHGLAPINGKFTVQGEVLTYTHLGENGDTKIGEQKCQRKKMYIVDVNDVLTMGELKCIIAKGISAAPALHIDQKAIEEQKLSLNQEAQEKKVSQVVDEEPDGNTLIGLEILRPDGTHENANQPEPSLHLQSEAKPDKVKETPLPQSPVAKPKENIQKKKAAPEKKPELRATKKKTGNRNNNYQNNDIEKILKKKKKVKVARVGHFAGILSRLVGDVYNAIFFFYAYLFFRVGENETLTSLSESLLPLFKKLEKIIGNQLPLFQDVQKVIFSLDFLKLIVAMILWNIVCGLLFSVNLGQWLIGLHASGPFIVKRLTAPLRVVISLLTWPFLIFDAPILFRKRSFKELVTNCETLLRSSKLTALLSLFIIPLITIYLMSYELFEDQEAYQTFKNNPIDTREVKTISAKKNLAENVNVKSLTFSSSHFGRTINARILRDIEFIGQLTNDSKTSNIKYFYLDSGINKYVEVTHRQLMVTSELNRILSEDPLFTFHSKGILPNKENELEVIDSKILKILYDALTLSQSNLTRHLSTYGVFINPYLKLRKKFLRKTNLDNTKNFLLLKKAGKYFITFDSSKNTHVVTTNDLGLSLYSFPSFGENARATKLLAKKFIEDVLFHSKVEISPIQPNNSYEILYHITKGKPLTQAQAKIIVDENMRLARDSFQKEDSFYTELLLEIFKSNEQQFLKFMKQNNDPVLSELRIALNRVQKALYKREKEFFEINNP